MIALAVLPRHSFAAGLVLILIAATVLFGVFAILAAIASRRRERDILVACRNCGYMYPENPNHPGYPDLHLCEPRGRSAAGSIYDREHNRDPRRGPDPATGHQRMDGDDE